MITGRYILVRVGAAILTATLVTGLPIAAQISKQVPRELVEVGIDQNLDRPLPLDLEFTDDTGRSVRLGDYFTGEKPVLLTLVYYECPMLCNIALDGLVQSLRGIDWVPGEEFEIVTVSIDPDETTDLAREKKAGYLRSLRREGAERGWHFMTGTPEAIETLADTVGFRYNYVPETGEFAHTAALFVITPEGRIARYLMGIKHDPRTLRLSLVEASDGKIGTPVDQFLLYCFRYDDTDGQYTPIAWRLMRLAGGVTVALLGIALIAFWRRDARKRPSR